MWFAVDRCHNCNWKWKNWCAITLLWKSRISLLFFLSLSPCPAPSNQIWENGSTAVNLSNFVHMWAYKLHTRTHTIIHRCTQLKSMLNCNQIIHFEARMNNCWTMWVVTGSNKCICLCMSMSNARSASEHRRALTQMWWGLQLHRVERENRQQWPLVRLYLTFWLCGTFFGTRLTHAISQNLLMHAVTACCVYCISRGRLRTHIVISMKNYEFRNIFSRHFD